MLAHNCAYQERQLLGALPILETPPPLLLLLLRQQTRQVQGLSVGHFFSLLMCH